MYYSPTNQKISTSDSVNLSIPLVDEENYTRAEPKSVHNSSDNTSLTGNMSKKNCHNFIAILDNSKKALYTHVTFQILGLGTNPLEDCEHCTYTLYLSPTELRMNDYYVFYYNNIAKLVVTGLIPLVALCFFNYKIYLAMR